MADRTAAVARIQRGLGFRTDLNTEVIDALKEAQRLLERGRTLPKFLIEEDQTLTVPADATEISLPTGFIRDVQDQRPHFTSSATSEIIFLEKVGFEEAKKRFATSAAGVPNAYTLRKSTIAVWPERDAIYALEWSYYKQATSLESNVENAWLEEKDGSPEALIGRAGMIMAEDLNHDKALVRFTRMHTAGWLGAIADDIMNEEESDPIIMGGRL